MSAGARAPLVGITGVTGFIGGHLVRQALAAGLRVRALRRASSDTGRLEGLGIEWTDGDIRELPTWERFLPGLDAVIHLAASGVTKIDDAFDAVHVNLPSIAHLFRCAAEAGVARIVLAGTCMEYGSTGERNPWQGLREDDPLAPTNAYAAAKAAASMIVAALARDLEREVFLLRPFYAYGPGDPAQRLVPAVIRMAAGGGKIRTTDGRQVRDFVHVDDVARAFLLAARARWPGGKGDHRLRIVNVGTGQATPLWKVIERIAVLCGRDPAEVELGAVPHRPHEMWRLVADVAMAEELLGWRARIPLEEGLAATVADAVGRLR